MKYIVLDQKITREKFAEIAYKRNYELLEVIEADPARGICDQLVWEDKASKVKIYYMEDYVIDLQYLVLEGKNAGKVEEEFYKAKDLKTIGFEKLEKLINKPKSRKDLVLALRMLAVISPKLYDEAYFDLFNQGLYHEDAGVRFCTIQVVTYPGWDIFTKIAKKIAKEDPHPEVKGIASEFVKQTEKRVEKKVAGKKVKSKSVKKKKA